MAAYLWKISMRTIHHSAQPITLWCRSIGRLAWRIQPPMTVVYEAYWLLKIFIPMSIHRHQNNDLISEMSTMEALQSKLQVLRDDQDNEFQVLFEDAWVLAAEVGVTPDEMSRVPRAPRSVYRPNAGAADQDSSAYYRVNIYFPMLESILQDLKVRFSPHQKKVAGLSTLVPSFISKSVWSV